VNQPVIDWPSIVLVFFLSGKRSAASVVPLI
jgi:hypothetical protein